MSINPPPPWYYSAMALPTLAAAQDVLDQVPDLGITALTTPSRTDVETWLNETTGEIVSRLRGAGVTIGSGDGRRRAENHGKR